MPAASHCEWRSKNAASGPITSDGTLHYGLMVANNSGVHAETDTYKRVYGQIAWYPAEPSLRPCLRNISRRDNRFAVR